MIQQMLAMSVGGGGGAKYKTGTFTSSQSGTTHVDCGFKPKVLIWWYTDNNTNTYVLIYDEEQSPVCRYHSGGSMKTFPNLSALTLPNSSNNQLNSIDNDGFTYGQASSASYVCTFQYWAIG